MNIKMQQNNFIKIAHITDFHIKKDNTLLYGINPDTRLSDVIEIILKNDYDIILCTGDLSEDGSVESYQKINTIFSKLNSDVLIIPGNHDNKQYLINILGKNHTVLEETISLSNWDIVPLPTCVPNKSYGYVPDEIINKIEDTCKKSKNYKAIVMHHHPIHTHGFMDKYMLKNNHSITNLMKNFSNIKGVFFGHIHQNMEIIFDKIFLGTISTCFNIKPKEKDMHIINNIYGYREIFLSSNGSIRNSTIYI